MMKKQTTRAKKKNRERTEYHVKYLYFPDEAVARVIRGYSERVAACQLVDSSPTCHPIALFQLFATFDVLEDIDILRFCTPGNRFDGLVVVLLIPHGTHGLD